MNLGNDPGLTMAARVRFPRPIGVSPAAHAPSLSIASAVIRFLAVDAKDLIEFGSRARCSRFRTASLKVGHMGHIRIGMRPPMTGYEMCLSILKKPSARNS